jgi:signal transduction histidine kinase/CheY-like chemotaxis protein
VSKSADSDDYRRLCEGFREGVAIQRGGELVYVNPRLASYLGYRDASELLGQSLQHLLSQHLVSARPGLLEPDTLSDQRTTTEVALKRDRLQQRIFELSFESRRVDGDLHLLATLSQKTTARNVDAVLEHAERLASLGTLAAGVAHEINNPLAYVVSNLGYSVEQLLRARTLVNQSALPGEVRGELLATLNPILEALEEAGEGTDRVARIVQSLKSFSRNESDGQGPVNLQSVLKSAVSMAENEIRYRAKLYVPKADVPAVHGNEAQLVQVFVNLLLNAAQAIPEGNPEDNRIEIATSAMPDGSVVTEISDSGTGIEEAMLDRIFDPFFTTKPIGVGTGLGLSICHGLVRGFGGSITVKSKVGKGSTFRVTLRPESEKAITARAKSDRPSRFRGELLIIDDEPMVLRAFRRTLAAHHNVEVVSNARGALEMIQQGKEFDLIFCDLMMPGMTGMDFHAELQHKEPDLAARVVFLTGGAFTSSARDYLDSVPNPALEKPLHPKALRNFVSRALV